MQIICLLSQRFLGTLSNKKWCIAVAEATRNRETACYVTFFYRLPSLRSNKSPVWFFSSPMHLMVFWRNSRLAVGDVYILSNKVRPPVRRKMRLVQLISFTCNQNTKDSFLNFMALGVWAFACPFPCFEELWKLTLIEVSSLPSWLT